MKKRARRPPDRDSAKRRQWKERWRLWVAEHQIARGIKAYQRDDYAKALRNFSAAALGGHPEAQYRLGLLYAHGHGVFRQSADAAFWYQKAAEQGHLDAQFQLSLNYLRGQPQRPNDEVWYQVARARDRETAECNAALLFPNGLSVPQNHAAALRWSSGRG